MKHCVLLVVLGTVACGSSDAAKSSTDFACQQSDRTGTYLAHYVERSGNCGPLPDTVLRLDEAPMGMGTTICTDTVAPRWSDRDCKLERSIHCEGTDGSVVDGTTITTQRDPDGDHITGLFTLTSTTASGATCTSTYESDAVRQ
jgi:hypothetical protein